VYQVGEGEWRELGVVAELVEALEGQPQTKALPIQVTGEEMLHLPFFHVFSSIISVANLVVIALFAYFVFYLPKMPMPWIAFTTLPILIIFYNAYAALMALSDEYVMNTALRIALSRKDGFLVLLMFVSLLGPDVTMLFCRLQLPKLGATISRTTERDLVFWAAGLHVVQDAPALAVNLVFHSKMGAAWDGLSIALLVVTALSLSFNLIWHVVRMATVRGEEDEALGDVARALSRKSSMNARSGSRRTLRKIETSKYVGLNRPGGEDYAA